jgi:hypothetical protein
MISRCKGMLSADGIQIPTHLSEWLGAPKGETLEQRKFDVMAQIAVRLAGGSQ